MANSVNKEAFESVKRVAEAIENGFSESHSILSFDEYFSLVHEEPARHLRNSAEYLRDVFQHYGIEDITSPTGSRQRFKLFDAPWDNGRNRLIGQEEAQNRIFSIIQNFVRQGRTDRFILMHGPNGSAKSTIADLIARGMEHYSTLDEGALYRFSWVFPNQSAHRSGIGFAESASQVIGEPSFAHLDQRSVDARLTCDLNDHPILLIPREQRSSIVRGCFGEDVIVHDSELATGDGDHCRSGKASGRGRRVSDYILFGDLCHRCRSIFDALLKAYSGDFCKVMRHVQIERFYVSRRYGVATARVEPQMAVDARVQQITADRSLGSLPVAVQHIVLQSVVGELVSGNRGLIDFADMFKRPLEASKYLLSAVESGQVAIPQANLFLDLVFLGSANESHVQAFMQSPEWTSFKARMELVRVPYLLDYRQEMEIYSDQLEEGDIDVSIAPHTAEVAALWGVLTRLRKPDPARYDKALKDLIVALRPLDKALLYAEGKVPERLDPESQKALRANIPPLYQEWAAGHSYEGRSGASVREIKSAILDAVQDPGSGCVGPSSVVNHLAEMIEKKGVYAFLAEEAEGQGYRDHAALLDSVREWYLDLNEEEVRSALGLVDESRYRELFDRYILHVTHYVRNEKIRDSITGHLEDPEPSLMNEVEKILGIGSEGVEEFRQGIMTKIGAWSVDNKGMRPEYHLVFPEHLSRLHDEYFSRERKRVQRVLRAALTVLADAEHDHSVAGTRRREVDRLLANLQVRYGYSEGCARKMIVELARLRYEE